MRPVARVSQGVAAAAAWAGGPAARPILLTAALLTLAGYVLLWVPAYRLNERIEYADWLLAAWPWVGGVLAGLLRLVGAIAPAALASYQGTAVLLVGLLAGQFVLYLLAVWLVGRVSRRLALGTLLALTALVQAVLLPLPGVFTTDLFSYAMYGEIAGRFGGSPYVQAPSDYPKHPLYLLINPLWRDAPSVYGPVWIAISSLVGATLGGQLLAETLAYRLLADLSHWLNLAVLWWALRRLRPGAEPRGLALYAWNPLVLFEFAGNGHNDGTMLVFLLLALGWLARGRALLAWGALVLSIGTKYTTGLLCPLVLWWLTRGARGWRRAALLAAGGVGTLVALAALYLPWWRGADTLGPVRYWLTTPLYANYAPIGLAIWLRDALAALGWGAPEELEPWVFGAQRQIVRAALLGLLAWELLRLRQVAELPLAGVRIWLAFLLAVNTWVLPWYYTWPLALAALSSLSSRTTWLAVAFTLSAPLSMYWAQASFSSLDVGGYLVYLAPLGGLVLWELVRRLRPAWRARAPLAPAGPDPGVVTAWDAR
jgi:hypothetical protein